MDPIYMTATKLRELGVDILAAHLLCMLREVPDFRRYPSVLAENLAAIQSDADLRRRVSDSADVAALTGALPPSVAAATEAYVRGTGDEAELLAQWRAESLARIGAAPYRLGSPTVQVPFSASGAVEVVALVDGARRKLRTGTPAPDLLAPPAPSAEALRFGRGTVEVIIVGDPVDPALADTLEAAAAQLRSRSVEVRWVWMHSLLSETPQAVLQAFYRSEQLGRLRDAPIEVIAAALRHAVPAQPFPRLYPADPRTALVLRDLHVLDACGVPRSRRPALVVGSTVHFGAFGAAFVTDVMAAGG